MPVTSKEEFYDRFADVLRAIADHNAKPTTRKPVVIQCTELEDAGGRFIEIVQEGFIPREVWKQLSDKIRELGGRWERERTEGGRNIYTVPLVKGIVMSEAPMVIPRKFVGIGGREETALQYGFPEKEKKVDLQVNVLPTAAPKLVEKPTMQPLKPAAEQVNLEPIIATLLESAQRSLDDAGRLFVELATFGWDPVKLARRYGMTVDTIQSLALYARQKMREKGDAP